MLTTLLRRLTPLLGVILVLAACGGDTAATTTTAADTTTTAAAADCSPESLQTKQPGTLTVATGEPAFPPWVIDDDPTNKQGFEAAVVYAIAEKLGYADDQVVWVRTGFDEAIAPGPKDYDFNIQQYSITEERDEVVDFSVPYYVTSQALVAYSDSPVTEAETLDDLKGYRLGAQIGTTSLDYIEQVIEPDTPPAVYDTGSDAKAGLEAGQVEALVFDLPTAYYITAVEIPEATIVGVLEASDEQADRYGLLFEEGSPITECVNQALEQLREEGTLDALAEEWLQQAGDIPTLTG
jgi:polar amino acid transport system substrate-binding protein